MMTEDFRGFLQQLQGCTVSVVTWDHARLLGTLASVTDDCVRMTGVVLQDSHETGGWADRLLIEDLLEDRGNQWPEIIIQRNLISTVTMVNDTRPKAPRSAMEALSAGLKIGTNTGTQIEIDESAVEHATPYFDSVCLEIGPALAPYVNHSGGARKSKDLTERMTVTRLAVETALGFQLQPFLIHVNLELGPSQFRVLIHGTEVGRGAAVLGKLLAIKPEKPASTPSGVETVEPVFGLPAVWIDPEQKHEAELAGWTVVEDMTVMGTMLEHHVKRHGKELLTYEAVSAAVENLRHSHPVTVSNLVPHPVSMSRLFEVLRALVAEGVFIRHILPIVESIGRHVEHCDSMQLLMSRVRSDLGLILCGPHIDENGEIPVIVVDSDLAQEVFPDQTEATSSNAQMLSAFMSEIRKLIPRSSLHRTPVLLVPHAQRERIWLTCRAGFEDLTVLSPAEVPANFRLKILGTLTEETLLKHSGFQGESQESPETLTELLQRKPR